MSTIPHAPTQMTKEEHWTRFLVTEMWASLAIVAMWIAVAVSAVWGPDFVSTSSGGNGTTIPSAVAVAIFASIGTWAVAKHGFGHRREEDR
jgi:hypothetical protein